MKEFERKIEKVCAMPQARALRAAVVTAVDAYVDFLRDNGVVAFIEFGRSTDEFSDNCVTKLHPWNEWRVKH